MFKQEFLNYSIIFFPPVVHPTVGFHGGLRVGGTTEKTQDSPGHGPSMADLGWLWLPSTR